MVHDLCISCYYNRNGCFAKEEDIIRFLGKINICDEYQKKSTMEEKNKMTGEQQPAQPQAKAPEPAQPVAAQPAVAQTPVAQSAAPVEPVQTPKVEQPKTEISSAQADELFKEENIPQSGWHKFDKIGEKVWGELVEIKDKEAEGDFDPQRVYVLKQQNGELINVGIAVTKQYVIDRANQAKAGDLLGFLYEKDIPATQKGMNDAKSIQVYVKAQNKEIFN